MTKPGADGEGAPPSKGKRKAAKRTSQGASSQQIDAAVEALLAELEHPLKADIEATRQLILSVSTTIREGVKWKAPSFRTSDDFLTFHLRSTDVVTLVFHTGAKAKASRSEGLCVQDPDGLLDWRAKDRALVTLGPGEVRGARGEALRALVAAWVAAVDG